MLCFSFGGRWRQNTNLNKKRQIPGQPMRCPGITYCGKFYGGILPHRLFSRLRERMDAPGQVIIGRKSGFSSFSAPFVAKSKEKLPQPPHMPKPLINQYFCAPKYGNGHKSCGKSYSLLPHTKRRYIVCFVFSVAYLHVYINQFWRKSKAKNKYETV